MRRMRAAAAGRDSGPDRYIAPRNRKTHVDDDEDAPAYVMEDGAQITAEEFKKLTGKVEGDPEDKDPGSAAAKEEGGAKEAREGKDGEAARLETEAKKTNVAEVGGPVIKKRKAGRIGGDADDAEEVEDKPREKKTKAKPKRKIKLSFGDEE